MAIDSLKSLVANVPDWLKRLDELTVQIDQRQDELAVLAEKNPTHPPPRSVRNRGSTESLAPRDDGAAHPPGTDLALETTPPPLIRHESRTAAQPPDTPASEPRSGSSLMRQKREVVATAQRRARAAVQRKPKTESMISGEAMISRYRNRSMIVVYYDSYVQSFFSELVKFVSAQRNVMRKAKMAAKVAHIRQMAELEMPDDDDDDDGGGELKPGDGPIAADPNILAARSDADFSGELKPRVPNPRLRSSGLMMHMRGRPSRLGQFNEKGDIWEELDKGLEYVQSMCEHAAHQFLRDGDCSEEIDKIQKRLVRLKETADKQLENAAVAEEPSGGTGEAAGSGPTAPANPGTARTYRPAMMRTESGASSTTPNKNPTTTAGLGEVDEGVYDMDDFKPA